MGTETWHYLDNQFDNATATSFKLMNIIRLFKCSNVRHSLIFLLTAIPMAIGILLPTDLSAQLTLNNSLTPTQLVNNVLLGKGVLASNIKYTGSSLARGSFNCSGCNLGLSNGILLATGNISVALGPNLVTDKSIPDAGNPPVYPGGLLTPGDASLTAIVGTQTYDAAVLEFDFIPASDTVKFKYVFASEEYHDWVDSKYNDAFAFFISGPGITGTQNIALIPGTTIPVAINNVNNGLTYNCNSTGPCKNCGYFVDNCNGSTIQFDGFTTPLTAWAKVNPCSTYHIKLVIADVSDGIWDSGVFLEVNSFTAGGGYLISGINTTAAQCSSNNGTATVTASGGTQPYTYTWSTAPVQNTATATGLAPGNYTVTVKDASGYSCFTSTATVTVASSGGFTVSSSQTNATCFGTNNGSALIIPNGGNAPYTFSWNTNPVQTTPSLSNVPAGNYTAIITDASGCISTKTISITQPAAITTSVSVINTLCGTSNGSAVVTAGGGTGTFSYSWSPGGQITSAIYGLAVGNYSCAITDGNGCTQSVMASITNSNGPTAFVGVTTTIFSGSSASLTASGGATYSWVPSASGGLSCATCANPVASPTVTTEYCVYVFDTAGCFDSACVTIFVVDPLDCLGSAEREIYLPNAFSPNGDGENDALQIYYGDIRCIETFKLVIYNRWGEKVFETTDVNFQWDGKYNGKIMNSVVLVYYLESNLTNGEKITKKGNITLIR